MEGDLTLPTIHKMIPLSMEYVTYLGNEYYFVNLGTYGICTDYELW